ncbi:hypothetical protein OTSGILL_2294 [Orientia tsutsugamushi str. Gilliam]|uniref:Uncharacterized protein n=1 Tax=Orientia tsutsugamushi str. Gilliam TaxID=1359184 RepID=A0A0F3M9Y7_ORITS|nr:hypothetical protein [Orientia tsutsugamushi]KJV51424.1 hypothetical protein OTSGILL_2294 [Orientia tsutsugamushi str. Gilliam]
MKSWKLQQLEQDLVKIVNNTLRGEIQEIQDEFNNTSNSAVILTGKQAVEASTEVLKTVKI